jgi:hypothetical protein
MQKAIELSKKIRKDLSKSWKEELEDYNLHKIFEGIYSLNISINDKNIIICFIVYSYSPESGWLDLNKDRLDNKKQILNNLGVTDVNTGLYYDVINNKNDTIGISIFNFLDQLKSWKWGVIFDLLDFASKMARFSTQETEEEKSFDKTNKKSGEVTTVTQDVPIEVISKVNKEKGILLDQSIAKRIQADNLLKEIKTEFVKTDEATQSDFGFIFTETAKKKDIMSWSGFIKEKNEKK